MNTPPTQKTYAFKNIHSVLSFHLGSSSGSPQKNEVSDENAPASRKSSLRRTQKRRWGRALEYGAGRGTHVRSRISRPAGGGKSGTPPPAGLRSSGPPTRPASSSNGANRAACVDRKTLLKLCNGTADLESFHRFGIVATDLKLKERTST